MKYARFKFNDENFGEEGECLLVWNDDEFIIISIMEDDIRIKKYKDVEELIIDYIKNKNELDFLTELVVEQEEELEKLKKYNMKGAKKYEELTEDEEEIK